MDCNPGLIHSEGRNPEKMGISLLTAISFLSIFQGVLYITKPKEGYHGRSSKSYPKNCLGEGNLRRRAQGGPGIRFKQRNYGGVHGGWKSALPIGLLCRFSLLARAPFRRGVSLGRKQRPCPCSLPGSRESLGHGVEKGSRLGNGN
jgi:hypothetical protein